MYPENVISHSVGILEENKISYALIGGFAVSFHSHIRTTKDIDFSILSRNDIEAESSIKYFLASGYRVHQVFEKKSLSRIAGVRLISPFTSLPEPDLDLLFLFSGIEEEIVRDSLICELLGIKIRVISMQHLIALKCLSANDMRLQDEIDIKELLAVTDQKTIDSVYEILDIITNRGFSDNVDLCQKYKAYLCKYTQHD